MIIQVKSKFTGVVKMLQMRYTIPQFIGCRLGLFKYETEKSGGFVDFDYFHSSDRVSPED